MFIVYFIDYHDISLPQCAACIWLPLVYAWSCLSRANKSPGRCFDCSFVTTSFWYQLGLAPESGKETINTRVARMSLFELQRVWDVWPRIQDVQVRAYGCVHAARGRSGVELCVHVVLPPPSAPLCSYCVTCFASCRPSAHFKPSAMPSSSLATSSLLPQRKEVPL